MADALASPGRSGSSFDPTWRLLLQEDEVTMGNGSIITLCNMGYSIFAADRVAIPARDCCTCDQGLEPPCIGELTASCDWRRGNDDEAVALPLSKRSLSLRYAHYTHRCIDSRFRL